MHTVWGHLNYCCDIREDSFLLSFPRFLSSWVLYMSLPNFSGLLCQSLVLPQHHPQRDTRYLWIPPTLAELLLTFPVASFSFECFLTSSVHICSYGIMCFKHGCFQAIHSMWVERWPLPLKKKKKKKDTAKYWLLLLLNIILFGNRVVVGIIG